MGTECAGAHELRCVRPEQAQSRSTAGSTTTTASNPAVSRVGGSSSHGPCTCEPRESADATGAFAARGLSSRIRGAYRHTESVRREGTSLMSQLIDLLSQHKVPLAHNRTNLVQGGSIPRSVQLGVFTQRGRGITKDTYDFLSELQLIHHIAGMRSWCDRYLCISVNEMNAGDSLLAHVDGHNEDPNWTLLLGEFTGGELQVQQQDGSWSTKIQRQGQWLRYSGKQPHRVSPVLSGRRWSVTLYTPGSWHQVHLDDLLGFPVGQFLGKTARTAERMHNSRLILNAEPVEQAWEWQCDQTPKVAIERALQWLKPERTGCTSLQLRGSEAKKRLARLEPDLEGEVLIGLYGLAELKSPHRVELGSPHRDELGSPPRAELGSHHPRVELGSPPKAELGSHHPRAELGSPPRAELGSHHPRAELGSQYPRAEPGSPPELGRPPTSELGRPPEVQVELGSPLESCEHLLLILPSDVRPPSQKRELLRATAFVDDDRRAWLVWHNCLNSNALSERQPGRVRAFTHWLQKQQHWESRAQGSHNYPVVVDDEEEDVGDAEHEDPPDAVSEQEADNEVTQADRELLYRMHCNLGHPPKHILLRALKAAGGRSEVMRYLSSGFECPECLNKQRQGTRRRATLPRTYSFNKLLAMDCFFLRLHLDDAAQEIPVLSMLCQGTNWHVCVMLERCNARSVWAAYTEYWVRAYGVPEAILTDGGSEFAEVFSAGLERQSVLQMMSDPESPWQNGRAERHGGWIKERIEMEANQPGSLLRSKADLSLMLAEVTAAKNRYLSRAGYSPEQLVFGRSLVWPGELLQEREVLELPQHPGLGPGEQEMECTQESQGTSIPEGLESEVGSQQQTLSTSRSSVPPRAMGLRISQEPTSRRKRASFAEAAAWSLEGARLIALLQTGHTERGIS
eukprot:933651-Amphidinium_carterae.2